MATSETTNLQLVKYGAGTDNFIRTDYNSNLDKIDTFAGNTNEAIGNLTNLKTTEKSSLVGAVNEIYKDTIQSPNNYYSASMTLSALQSDIDAYVLSRTTLGDTQGGALFGYMNTTSAQAVGLSGASFINAEWTGKDIILVRFDDVATSGTIKWMKKVNTWGGIV